jgi:hypothetical protein
MSHHLRGCVCVLSMMVMSWTAYGSVQIEEGL